MAVDCTFNSTLTAIETLPTGSLPTLTARVTHTGFNIAKILGAATTPPVTKIAAFVAALVAGSLNIDLTALTGTNGGIVDGTGLRLQFLRIANLGANDMTITQGASNAYAIGAGLKIPAGGSILLEFNDGISDIDATHKNLLLTGTLVQTANVTIILG
jgi:hypothetical protein